MSTSTKGTCRFEILIRNPKLPHIGSFFLNIQEDHACELFQKIAAKDNNSLPQIKHFSFKITICSLFHGYKNDEAIKTLMSATQEHF